MDKIIEKFSKSNDSLTDLLKKYVKSILTR